MAVNFAEFKATTDHNTAAYLGPALGVYQYDQPSGVLTVASGGIDLNATSINTATVSQGQIRRRLCVDSAGESGC